MAPGPTSNGPENLSAAGDAYGLLPLVIIGAGGHAVSVANVALSAGYAVKYFVDASKKGSQLLGASVIGDIADLQHSGARFSYAIAVGDNSTREKIHRSLAVSSDLHFPSLVHQSAVVSFFSNVGEGTIVMPKAVVGPNSRVGRFCLINTQASIDHDCVMLDFSSLAPAAVTGGGVEIGLRSAICMGAAIKHGVKVGHDSVVGANSYLNKNLGNNKVAYGTPAKEIRGRRVGDCYLG